ncbi:MAG: argininosuccinate lyase [Enterocloster sp.]
MRKQTKLVAVLSTAALLAIGASMTSFAATGWAEEDGTWVYYDRNGDRVTDRWAKSGNNWYWLDSDGEMAVDQLIEDGDNYYYVDINGVMASNQWVAIENEDAGDDNEPDHYWYYFQANGKALTNGNNSKVALKTINGKKYAFTDEGKMLYGWVDSSNAERVDNTDGDGFKTGDYYFGTEDDGAMTTGWLQMDVTYEEAESDYEVAPVFNDDADQTRWFYFQSNGKKVKADTDNNKVEKEKTINGKKYAFDQYGAMIAEWSLDVDAINSASASEAAGTNTDYTDGGLGTNSSANHNDVSAKYAQQWRYFNSVEDGARVSKGWFKVVAAEYLNNSKYDDDEDAWYYADGSGNLYAGEFKTIKGKKYAFRDDGRMIDGLKFIAPTSYSATAGTYDGLSVKSDDDSTNPYDTEEDFLNSALVYDATGYDCYYFGDGEDGAMRTNKATVEIDGDKFNFYFSKSGSNKGAGITDIKDDKIYQSGMLLTAGTDEKYQVVQTVDYFAEGLSTTAGSGYTKLDDVEKFLGVLRGNGIYNAANDSYTVVTRADFSGTNADTLWADAVKAAGITKSVKDLDEVYLIKNDTESAANNTTVYGTDKNDFRLVNTSGKIIDSKSRNKDGNDFYYVVNNSGEITAIYTED